MVVYLDSNVSLSLISVRAWWVIQGWAKISSDVFLCNRRDAGLLTSEKSKAWHIPLYK